MKPAERTIYINEADEAFRELVRWRDLDMAIFNAPRPLPSNAAWIGEFRHGTFYAGIIATQETGDQFARDQEEWMRKECESLDAYPVILVTNEQIRGWVEEHLVESEIPLADALEGWGGWPALAKAGGWPYMGKE